jgi:hypothetical protein
VVSIGNASGVVALGRGLIRLALRAASSSALDVAIAIVNARLAKTAVATTSRTFSVIMEACQRHAIETCVLLRLHARKQGLPF